MPSTYTNNIRVEKIATGEQGGSWGDTTNSNFDRLDVAINGIATETLTSGNITSGGAAVLELGTSTTDETGRNQFIIVTDAGDIGGSGYVKLETNTAEKICVIRNSLSNSRSLFVFQGTYDTSNDLEIPNGKDVLVKFDGAGSGAVVELAMKNAYFETLQVTGATTVGGNLTVTGDLTVSGDDITMGTNTSGHMLIADGTNYNPVAMSGDATISNTGALTISAGAVTSAKIANNSVALSTQTTGNYIATLTAGTDVSFTGSASAEGATPTIAVDSTDANTASKIVKRDSSGNFSAGTVTASLTGNVTGNVTGFANKLDTAGDASGWKVEASGTDLHFIYNGTTVASLESNGLVRFANDVVAFDSTP